MQLCRSDPARSEPFRVGSGFQDIITLQELDNDRLESDSILYGFKLVASSVSPTHSDHTKHPTNTSVSATHYIIIIRCTPSAGNKPPSGVFGQNEAL